jgi:DNA-binding FadR family transcriptional regulator
MPFKPVETKKVYMRVVEQIRAMIESGELGPGAQLPTTHELADTLQVSRPSVREALAALEILELVESKAGSGCYVRRKPATGGTRRELERAPVSSTWASAEEILEARLAYEPACARLAAERRTPDDLSDMRCTPELRMVDIDRVTDGLPARFGDCQSAPRIPPEDFTVSLHAAIARATRNTLLSTFGDAIAQSVRSPTWQRMMRQIYLSPKNMIVLLKQYEDLYDAIARKDGPAAEALMREHLLALSATLNE